MKFIDLREQFLILQNEIEIAIARVHEHGKYIMGPEVDELERTLEIYTGSKYCLSCASGTDALTLSLMAAGVGPGDKVLTTPLSFIATADTIVRLGAKPVFVDIHPDTWNIDPFKLERAAVKTRKTKAVIPVNLFGMPCDYDSIMEIAEEHNLIVIEDAAQSFGARYKNKLSCNLGHIGCTSFFPAKPLGCYGDGGAVFTNDEKIAGEIFDLRAHGLGMKLGLNSRLDSIQAAVLLQKLKIFDEELEKRKLVAERYRKHLPVNVVIQSTTKDAESSLSLFSICCDRRDDLLNELIVKCIPARVYYKTPLHLSMALKEFGYYAGNFPVAESVAERILSLPIHPYLAPYEQNFVFDTIREFYK